MVVVVTATVILGMFIAHKWSDRERELDVFSNGVFITSAQPKIHSSSSLSKDLPSKGPFRVTRVIDGDTLVLDNGETVRLIGVDAPETNHPEIPVQRFGKEATEFLRRFAEGFECLLEYEPDDIRDAYGRLLAYVFIGGELANAEIIRRGYAYAYTRFPFSRKDEFMALEREARRRQYGLWDLSLKDGRITNLINRYDSLSLEGREKLDEILDELIQKYPFEKDLNYVDKK